MPKTTKIKVKKGQKQRQKQAVKVSQKVNVIVNRTGGGFRRPPKQQPATGFGSGTYFIEKGVSSISANPFKTNVESKEQLDKKVAGGMTTNTEGLKNIAKTSIGVSTEPEKVIIPSSVSAGISASPLQQLETTKMVETGTSTRQSRGRPRRSEQTFITPSRQAVKEAMLPIWNEPASSTPTTDVERTVMPTSNVIRRTLKSGQKIEFNVSPQEGESDFSESEVNKLFPSQKNK